MRCPIYLAGLLLVAVGSAGAAEKDDLVLADFEGTDYGTWTVTGDAFGKGPARGTLPNQMPVDGFKGKGLVNSYHGGDKSTGTLRSPEFTLERHYVTFLIGGGHHPGKTCINLLVDGKVVQTATGPNKQPGGTEHLDPHSWDVGDLAGKKATIEIIDEATGGWGHLNIDHIVLTERKPPQPLLDVKHTLTLEKRYLNFPVKNGGPKRRVSLSIDGKKQREFEIELADDKPDFWVFLDVAAWKSQQVVLQVDRLSETSQALKSITQSDTPEGMTDLYREKQRPQFHFTSRRGWLNDPNGLVYSKGEYHLYYQHNPYGWSWGNMHWGHAVSKDLLHWTEEPIALYPRQFGDWCFSGSAVVDRDNTSGWKKGDAELLVAAYTSTGRGECIAYSLDQGRTWSEPEGNPVVKHSGRDPRLLWHTPTKRWVMAVYSEQQGKQWIAFHSSADLKTWRFESKIDGFFECPDLLELPVDGDAKKSKWILYGADGKYLVGSFDGKSFTRETGKHQLWYGNFYAAQTVSDAPDGRRIQIGWGQGIEFPGMPFNQQMVVPCELTLRTTSDGIRLHALPVKEFATLRNRTHTFEAQILKPGDNPLARVEGELFDLSAAFQPAGESITFTLRGVPVTYDVKKQVLSCKGRTLPLRPIDGVIRLRMLVDRGSLEIFGNDGQVALSVGSIQAENKRTLEVSVTGNAVKFTTLEVHELKSAWK